MSQKAQNVSTIAIVIVGLQFLAALGVSIGLFLSATSTIIGEKEFSGKQLYEAQALASLLSLGIPVLLFAIAFPFA